MYGKLENFNIKAKIEQTRNVLNKHGSVCLHLCHLNTKHQKLCVSMSVCVLMCIMSVCVCGTAWLGANCSSQDKSVKDWQLWGANRGHYECVWCLCVWWQTTTVEPEGNISDNSCCRDHTSLRVGTLSASMKDQICQFSTWSKAGPSL